MVTRRPANTIHARTNVTGKNHRFGIRFRRHEIREFGVPETDAGEFG
ncbi:MAG: hypothetical protein WD448_03330 [Woeseia sp.]